MRLNFLKQYVNDADKQIELDDKVLFARKYDGLLNRKWCDFQNCSLEEFREIFLNCDKLIVKDLTGRSGVGINTYEVHDNFEEIYNKVKETGREKIVEEYFYQKGLLHEFNPSSLNTLRVSTIRVQDEIKVLFAFLRAGREGSVVDNFHSGGVAYSIDINSGELQEGTVMSGKTFKSHPGTNVVIQGLRIPNWSKVCQFCIQAHQMASPGLEWIGWDVCVSDEEIFLIEGNAGPLSAKPIDGNDNQWKRVKQFLAEYDKMKSNSEE